MKTFFPSRKASLYTVVSFVMLVVGCSSPSSHIVSPGLVPKSISGTGSAVTTDNQFEDLVPSWYSATSKYLEVGSVSPKGSSNRFRLVKISGIITGDLRLQEGVGYFLDGLVTVGQDVGSGGAKGVLNIPKGVKIYGGEVGGRKSQLVINRGSQIIANGTEGQPIVFTSLKEREREKGWVAAKPDATGEWVGIMINGLAPINNCQPRNGTPYCGNEGEASSGKYGGNIKTDNSGKLKYVRVEYAGIFYNSADQSNGIAFQGVGSGTEVSHIQVHNNGDDGIEFFGGTVSANHVVITGASDDSIDWTDGWQGTMQNVLVLQTDDVGDRMIEADNRLIAAPHELPRSKPKIANFTLIGNGEKDAILLREGTGVELYNGIVVGAKTGIVFGDEATYGLLNTPHNSDQGRVVIESLILNNEDETKSLKGVSSTVTATEIKSRLGRTLEDVNIDETNFIPGPAIGNIPKLNSEGLPLFLASNSRELTASEVKAEDLSTVSPLTVKAALGKLPLANLSNVDGLQWTDKEYIGAFSPSETVNENWAFSWTKPGTVFHSINFPSSCPDGTAKGGRMKDYLVCIVSGTIEENLTLPAWDNIVYRLEGRVFVGEDTGPSKNHIPNKARATLTIEPGVMIFGESSQDGLIINRGSKIMAEGTEDKPIVMTSGATVRDEANYATDTAKWLGLTVNGKAGVNMCRFGGESGTDGGTDRCQSEGEGSSGKYGGSVDTDDSGSLKYVRVEFAGIFFDEQNQSNGIAFQGVGSGTQVEYVQVHNNGDDGVEFFGGTVNAKYLVITGAGDDSVDWTDGWRGNIQYLIIEQTSESDMGFEGDSREEVSPDFLPRSSPDIANFTILGNNNKGGGMLLREGTAGRFVNGIIAGNKTGSENRIGYGIDIDDPSASSVGSYKQLTDGNLILSSIFIDSETPFVDDSSRGESFTGDDVQDKVKNLKLGPVTLAGNNTFYENSTNFGFIPGTAEASATAYDSKTLNEANENFFAEAQYVGAVKDRNDKWYLGWTVNYTGNKTSK